MEICYKLKLESLEVPLFVNFGGIGSYITITQNHCDRACNFAPLAAKLAVVVGAIAKHRPCAM